MIERTKEWPLVRTLAEEIWREYYPRMISSEQIEYMLKWRYSDEALVDDDAEGVEYYLVRTETDPVGFIGLGREGDDVKLHKLYLRDSARGRGLGAEALAFVTERAKALGGKRIILNVNKANTQAIKAYERAGFSRDSSLVLDIGSGYVMDDYIYAKVI